MAFSLDPTVLGHLLLLQGTLPAAPDAERLAELLGHGLEQVPGVADAVVCVGGVVYPADSPEADAAAAAARRPEDEREWADGCVCPPGACPLDGQGRRRFSLRTSREVYGALFLHLADDPVDLQRSRQSPVDVYVACVGPDAERYALTGADILRDICRVEIDTSGRSLKAQAKAANQRLARVLLIAGDEEIDQRVFQLKHLDTGEQRPVDRDHILTAVREVLEQ